MPLKISLIFSNFFFTYQSSINLFWKIEFDIKLVEMTTSRARRPRQLLHRTIKIDEGHLKDDVLCKLWWVILTAQNNACFERKKPETSRLFWGLRRWTEGLSHFIISSQYGFKSIEEGVVLDEMLFPICHKISPIPLQEQRVEEILPKMVSQKDTNITL